MDLIPQNPCREDGNRKLIYCTQNAKIVPGNSTLKSFNSDVIDVMVLMNENFVHGEWSDQTRSSQILGVTYNELLGTVDVETNNSIYRVLDGSVAVTDMTTAQIESLYEATFEDGCGYHMPSPTDLVKLFDSHAMYAYFKNDNIMVNMLDEVSDPTNDNSPDKDWFIRLRYRAPLRRFLTLFRENGGNTQCDLSFGRM